MEEDPASRSDAPPWPLVGVAGLLMGAADAVPGVSGGTIALIVGIYERLIGSIAALVRLPRLVRTPDGRHQIGRALSFLVPLGLGVALAWFVGTRLLVGPTEDPGLLRRADTAPLCYAFFFGLVLFSLPEPWRRIDAPDRRCFGLALVAAVLVAWLVGLEHASTEPATWMLLYGGALAIAVMLLPGISGSLMLLVIGQYTAVAGAVHDAADGKAEGFLRAGVFGLGVIAGLVLFVPVLRRLLRRHHDLTMAALTGLMAGSLRSLWPWKSHYDLKAEGAGRMLNVGVGGDVLLVLLAAAAGAATVWALRRLERRLAPAA